MKILVLSKSIPFPPRNGVELPLARIFEQIGLEHTVDFLIISEDEEDLRQRQAAVPSAIRQIFHIRPRYLSPKQRLLNELTQKQPAFFAYTFDPSELKHLADSFDYDLVWVNPPGNITFLRACNQLGLHFYRQSILGLNDLVTSLYSKHLQEMIHRKIFDRKFLTFWLRSFWIGLLERKYLYDFDFIHLQTPREAEKAIRLLKDPTFKERIIICPNGIKSHFLDFKYQGHLQRGILYMTHLDGERSGESKWFLRKIWPKIRAETDAELWLVGTPPAQPIPLIDADKRIKVFGFVEDLRTIYEHARLAVIPIFHNCGLINRIQDALTAGLPIVTTQIAAQTFDGLQNGVHAYATNDPETFAAKTVHLFQNDSLREAFSKDGRAYVAGRPTWVDAAKIIIQKVEQKIGVV